MKKTIIFILILILAASLLSAKSPAAKNFKIGLTIEKRNSVAFEVVTSNENTQTGTSNFFLKVKQAASHTIQLIVNTNNSVFSENNIQSDIITQSDIGTEYYVGSLSSDIENAKNSSSVYVTAVVMD